jgi:hypothetical protein
MAAPSKLVFRIRFVELGVDGTKRIIEFPHDFPSKDIADGMVEAIVKEQFKGQVPLGFYFEVYSLSPDGVEQSYGQWLGRRAAKIGVIGAIGAAVGWLLQG